MNQIGSLKKISFEAKKVSDDFNDERWALQKDVQNLNKWSADFEKSTVCLQEVNEKFKELLSL